MLKAPVWRLGRSCSILAKEARGNSTWRLEKQGRGPMMFFSREDHSLFALTVTKSSTNRHPDISTSQRLRFVVLRPFLHVHKRRQRKPKTSIQKRYNKPARQMRRKCADNIMRTNTKEKHKYSAKPKNPVSAEEKHDEKQTAATPRRVYRTRQKKENCRHLYM